MRTTRKLNIKDWSGYFVKEMVNILDVQPEYFTFNYFKGCKDDSTIFNVCYCEEHSVPRVVFNNIKCLYVLIMSRMRFRVNPHSIVA